MMNIGISILSDESFNQKRERTLLQALPAHLALLARVRQPFDTDPVTDLHRRVDGMLANSNDIADTLMSTNERDVGWNGPITLGGVKVGVADTGAMHLNETFAGLELAGLGNGVVSLEVEFTATLGDDGGRLGLGYLGHVC